MRELQVFAGFLGFLSIYFMLSPYVVGFGVPLPWRRQGRDAEIFRARDCWMALAVTALGLMTALVVLLMAWTGTDGIRGDF